MIDFRTDLADERQDIYRKINNIQEDIPGIETESQDISENIRVGRVKILDAQGEEKLGKPVGTYITIDVKKLKIASDDDIQKASEVVTAELTKVLEKHIDKKDDILVVGLGNGYVTPDSLGPKVVKEVDITRHFLKHTPQYIDPNTRPVSAVAPGVLGTTGIETMEIVQGIVENVKPKLVIVIDSLASKSIERISSTIQIADTGIVPGAGVDNIRNELSQKTVGIPVIAIGVPMVVDLATITDNCLDIFIDNLQKESKSNEILNRLKEQSNYDEIKSALSIKEYNMIVNPKEIDELIENMKDVVVRGINFAL